MVRQSRSKAWCHKGKPQQKLPQFCTEILYLHYSLCRSTKRIKIHSDFNWDEHLEYVSSAYLLTGRGKIPVRNGTKIQPNHNKGGYSQQELLFNGRYPQLTLLPAFAAREYTPFSWDLQLPPTYTRVKTHAGSYYPAPKTQSDSSHNNFKVSFSFSTRLNGFLSWENKYTRYICALSTFEGSQGSKKALSTPVRCPSWPYFQLEVGRENSWGPFHSELSLKMNRYNKFFPYQI